jgi:hypothetical protein
MDDASYYQAGNEEVARDNRLGAGVGPTGSRRKPKQYDFTKDSLTHFIHSFQGNRLKPNYKSNYSFSDYFEPVQHPSASKMKTLKPGPDSLTLQKVAPVTIQSE